jgi:hypothetical protein
MKGQILENPSKEPFASFSFPMVELPPGEEEGLKKPDLHQLFIEGLLPTPIGEVPKVSASLDRNDRWGSIKARWGVGRMNYTVDPGLYALGTPGEDSPVLVTANYKMSFDRLRSALPGRDAWILVLNTGGINVWCASGKGTFGAEELVRRVEFCGVAKVVRHRRLILPQLSAPGTAAHKVMKFSGFKVVYGPVRAEDLAAFLDSGMTATPAMRIKTFTFQERLVLVPVELVEAMKIYAIILPGLLFLGGLGGGGGFWLNVIQHGLFAAAATLAGIIAGAVLTPMLLPWLPGRAFALKGAWMGLVPAAALVAFRPAALQTKAGLMELAAWCLLILAVAAYLGMNFTGASTYTSLSGVKKEMRWAVPMEIAAAVVGLGLWVTSRFIA